MSSPADLLAAFRSGSEPARLLFKSRHAALALQISERKLFDLAKRGLIPVVRLDKSVRFDVRDLIAYIDAHKGPRT